MSYKHNYVTKACGLAFICSGFFIRYRMTVSFVQILSCVTQLLQSDSTPQVQQAALLVISLLLKGLSRHTVHILGDSLRDVYRLLKRVDEERERDELTRTHARAALGQLDSIMRGWVFPQQTLTKNITILQ